MVEVNLLSAITVTEVFLGQIENGGDLASLALRVDEVWADLLARAAGKETAEDVASDGTAEE